MLKLRQLRPSRGIACRERRRTNGQEQPEWSHADGRLSPSRRGQECRKGFFPPPVGHGDQVRYVNTAQKCWPADAPSRASATTVPPEAGTISPSPWTWRSLPEVTLPPARTCTGKSGARRMLRTHEPPSALSISTATPSMEPPAVGLVANAVLAFAPLRTSPRPPVETPLRRKEPPPSAAGAI